MVLRIKKLVKSALNIVKLEVHIYRRQIRDKLIGVMAYLRHVVLVFVISGIIAFNPVNTRLQILFQGYIIFLRRVYVLVLGEVGGNHKRICPCCQHDGAGRKNRTQPCNQKCDCKDHAEYCFMPPDKGDKPPCGPFGVLRRFLCRLCGLLRPFRLLILFLYALLLLKLFQHRFFKLWIFRKRFFVNCFDFCLFCFMLEPCRFLIRRVLALPVYIFCGADAVVRQRFRFLFGLMRRLYSGIFMFSLCNFAVQFTKRLLPG